MNQAPAICWSYGRTLGNIAVFSCECLREAAALVARAARKHKLRRVATIVPPLPKTLPGKPDAHPAGSGADVGADALATGLMLASFDWIEYRGKVTKKKHEHEATTFTLVFPDADVKTARESARRAVVIAEGQNFARTIASRPGNEINPPALVEIARQLAREVAAWDQLAGLVARLRGAEQS
jgi:leucyl aminopeptidase